MAILNYVKREIVAKIVYYGPGLSGKTLNIQKVHESMDPANVGELTSLATESDRTLFFDFVPIQLGKIAGLETRFQLFTVPGQVFYNQTRRRVLEDADGIVFVADSQPEQLENNLVSLANLEENLGFYGKKLPDVPYVIQFNKQDIPGCMTEEELNKVLNKYGAPAIRASCIENFGVMETLAKISTTVLAHLREQMTKKSSPNAPPTGIKRTYSKEGVSDEQVVKNLLEDIAASGGIAEAQAAGDIPKAPAAAAKPAPPPAPRPPIAPVASATAPKPVVPRPTLGAAPKAIVPAGAAAKPAAARAPAAPPGLSAEDLLSGLDGSPAAAPSRPAPAAAATKPATAPSPSARASTPATVAPRQAGGAPVVARERVSIPGPAKPPAPSTTAPAAPPRPAATPGNGARAAGLRSVTPPPIPSPPPGKTADELLESMDRSTDAGLEQESGGSFDTPQRKKKTGNPLWDSDDEQPGNTSKPFSILDDDGATGANDAGEEGDGKTNVANVAAMMKGGANSEPDRNTPPPPSGANKKPASLPAIDFNLGGESTSEADLRVASVGSAARGADGSLEFDVQISDGAREVPVKLVIPLSALKGLAGPSTGGGAGTALGVINLLLILGLAVFNVLTFLGIVHR